MVTAMDCNVPISFPGIPRSRGCDRPQWTPRFQLRTFSFESRSSTDETRDERAGCAIPYSPVRLWPLWRTERLNSGSTCFQEATLAISQGGQDINRINRRPETNLLACPDYYGTRLSESAPMSVQSGSSGHQKAAPDVSISAAADLNHNHTGHIHAHEHSDSVIPRDDNHDSPQLKFFFTFSPT